MKRNYVFMLCFITFCMTATAQTGNESLGNSVTPLNNIPTPYDGVITLDAPGTNITTGDYNTLLGDGAGGQLTTSRFNVLIGTAAGALLATSTEDNVVIGPFAADQTASTAFDDNVVIGTRAARTLAGNDNVVIGDQSGRLMTTSNDNVVIGNESGYDLTEGDKNVFLGNRAGYNTTTASENVFVGHHAGYNNSTGEGNTFVGGVSTNSVDGVVPPGKPTGNDNTVGINNAFFGSGAGGDNGQGNENTFIGADAGARNEFGDYNTFVGYQAGARNNVSNNQSNANNNTFVGWRAGERNEEGSNNVVMGYDAGFAQDGSNNNVIIGYEAKIEGNGDRSNTVLLGSSANTTNNNVVAIGADTNVTADYAVAIGTGATTAQANSMVLGGDTVTDRLSVGIGTATPNENASLTLADTDKGLLVNRVTNAQRTAMVTTPASGVALAAADEGLLVYDTDDKLFYFWTGTQWSELGKTVGSGVSAVPDLLNYQTAVRDNAGLILTNQMVNFRMSVIDVTAGNTTVYSETHSATTSAQGLVDFQIGNGTPATGVFTDIDWSHNNSLQVEIDPTGGSTYATVGTMSFVSVPYALRARYAENLTSSTNNRTASAEADRIQSLEQEVAQLKAMVNKLLKE